MRSQRTEQQTFWFYWSYTADIRNRLWWGLQDWKMTEKWLIVTVQQFSNVPWVLHRFISMLIRHTIIEIISNLRNCSLDSRIFTRFDSVCCFACCHLTNVHYGKRQIWRVQLEKYFWHLIRYTIRFSLILTAEKQFSLLANT